MFLRFYLHFACAFIPKSARYRIRTGYQLAVQMCVCAFTFVSLSLSRLKFPRTGFEQGTIWLCKCVFAILPSFRFHFHPQKRPAPDSNRAPCPVKKAAGLSGDGEAEFPKSPVDPKPGRARRLESRLRWPAAWPVRLTIWVAAEVNYSS